MDQNWEEIHRKEDAAVVKKIAKCNSRSSTFLLLGIGTVLFGISIFQEMITKMLTDASAKANASGGQITVSEIFALVDKGSLVFLFILGIIALIFFSRSMLNWEKAESLAGSRFFWIPGEEEIEYINQRFDNEMVRSLIDSISSENTKQIEVGFEELTIKTNEGTFACYYNQHGYSHIDNYGTKQLAYYLASKCFPNGFVIYQKKVAPVGANRYLGGVTEVGVEKKKEKRIKRYATMINWLAVQIQDKLRLGTGFKMPEAESGPSPTNDGQIVINKGYTSNKDGMMPL